MTETTTVTPRFRSPPYPSISLAKAVERAKLVYSKAQHHAVSSAVLAEAWGYSAKSGGTFASAAALIHFGLLLDEGTGAQRKFRLSEDAQRIIRDAEPNSAKRVEAIKRAALLPKIYAELWSTYGQAAGLSDAILKNHLTLDRRDSGQAPFSDGAAEEVIQTFRDTISFAGLTKFDAIPVTETDVALTPAPSFARKIEPSHVKVGDCIQWTSGGVDQFKVPTKVEKISDDGAFLWVFGSPMGVPIGEATVVPIGSQAPAQQTKLVGTPQSGGDLRVYLKDGRLQITADVDADGIEKLKKILTKYEEILKLL